MSDLSEDLEKRNIKRTEVVYPWNGFYWREIQKVRILRKVKRK